MSRRGIVRIAALGVCMVLATAACGSEDEGSTVAPANQGGEASYKPVSDVAAHLAIGKDAAEIRALMEPARSGGSVEWGAVEKIFAEGKSSKRGDGLRTLASLVPDDPATALVRDAIRGSGGAMGATDPVRRQKVDKGITVILERKVLEELETALDKARGRDTAPATGAPHNVDEAWAFYTAEGQGPASTAEKRAADFKKGGQVDGAVITALKGAQAAAGAGDASKLDAAIRDAEAALDYIFYLATFKYLDTKGDPVTRAEGETFYEGIRPEVATQALDADKAITAAFASGPPEPGRTALNTPSVLTVLGVSDEEKVTQMP